MYSRFTPRAFPGKPATLLCAPAGQWDLPSDEGIKWVQRSLPGRPSPVYPSWQFLNAGLWKGGGSVFLWQAFLKANMYSLWPLRILKLIAFEFVLCSLGWSRAQMSLFSAWLFKYFLSHCGKGRALRISPLTFSKVPCHGSPPTRERVFF